MAKEFIIKNGLILNESNSIRSITSGDTILTNNENALVSEYTIKKNMETYFPLNISSATNHDHLEYNSSSSKWENVSDFHIEGDLYVTGETKLYDTLYTKDILPHEHLTYDIGAIGQRYNTIYARKFKSGTASTEYGDGEIICSATTSGFTIDANLGDIKMIGDLIPDSDKSHTIGLIDNRWNIAYVDIISATTLYGDASNLTGLNIPTEIPTLNIRYTGTTPPNTTAAFAPVDFDSLEIENENSIIQWDTTNTTRILIKETGLYEIYYGTNVLVNNTTDSYAKVRINGTTDIVNSNNHVNTYTNERQIMSGFFTTYLTGGTYVELLIWIGDGSSDNCENTIFNIEKSSMISGGGSGGSGTPGGNDTEIQFNSSGSFAGNSNLTWDGTSLGTSSFELNNYLVSSILDEDTMVSDSTTALATQQSIKAYVDSKTLVSYSEQPVVQVNLINQSLTSTPLAIPFNVTSIENNTSILEHNNTTTSRLDIKKIGLYRITYSFEVGDTSNTSYDAELRLNGSVLANSDIFTDIYRNTSIIVSKNIIYDITSIGYLELFINADSASDSYNITLNITKLDILSPTISLSGITDVILTSSQNGDALVYDGTNWVNSAITSGGGTPGGNDTEIQFNSSGSFDGSSNLTWNGSKMITTNIETTSLSSTTLTLNNYSITDILDEDTMVSDSTTALATQQSIKKYIDDKVISGKTFNTYPTVSQTVTATDITVNYSTIRTGSVVASISSGVITMLVGGERTIIITHSNSGSTNRTTAQARLQIDTGSGFIDVVNASCFTYHRSTTDNENTGTISATLDLNVGDKLQVLTKKISGTDLSTLPDGCSFTMISTTGEKGEQGIQGIAGASGDINWQGTWISKNYIVNETVEYNGSSYVCILNTTSSQIPTNTTYWDLVALKGNDGAGSSVIIQNNGSGLGSFTSVNFNSNLTATDAGSGVAEVNFSRTQEYMVPIWAEENASLAAATYEWAFGNGANTPNDGGVTIYVPTGWSCEVVAMSLRLGGGTATVELVHNGTLQGSNCNVVLSSGLGTTNDSFTAITISNNDYLNFRTTTAAGTSSPAVATMWLRYYK